MLHVDLTGRDPDEGMTRVPYEKGALFFRAIEQACRARSTRRIPSGLLQHIPLAEHHDGPVRGFPAREAARRRSR